jgi:hypothetical protein
MKETLDMDEMEKNINNILDVCPQEMTVPDMCAVIAPRYPHQTYPP